ncbi:hypothetical protein PNEG_00198 [Pneumocystis murina B123]|uniref:Nucleolar complex-associated protein 3 n=1 Tax=Pneumocystis murina (strain B123) TaxID=1069680 RepID=M7PD15_PNEMU|nr:hypothetical protein PNEG_00198 [Pneumocystis murina B123]EMR11770.1 hypothetical protein PNEG_00198 [Pneumocystis murina B123]
MNEKMNGKIDLISKDKISKKAGILTSNLPLKKFNKKMKKKEIERKKRKKDNTYIYYERDHQGDELPYEKMGRSFNLVEDLSNTFTLPIKTRDGQVRLKREKNTGKKVSIEPEIIKAKNETKDIEIKDKKEKDIKEKDIKEKLASIAQIIIENPEENIGQLKILYNMTICNTISIQRLGLLTQLAVYRDIIPGYSIRPLTEIEKASSVSKEIKKRRLFEELLVSNYHEYVSLLSRTIKAGYKFPKKSPQQFLSDISFSCICYLLLSAPHFNYRDMLLDIISTKLTHKKTDVSFNECKKTIEELFKNDKEGEISLEIVKKLTNAMKKKNYNINDKVLNIFLKLEFLSQSNIPSEKKINNPRKRKHEKQFMSKKMRKLEKEKKEIENEMDSIKRNNQEKAKIQGKILKLIFTTYFQILRNGLINHIYASLEGLEKFSHLINVDFFEDLLKLLKELLENTFSVNLNISIKNNTKGGLLCIVVAFKLLSQQAQMKETINLDLSAFIFYLYSIMIPMSLNSYIEADIVYKSKKQDDNISNNDNSFTKLSEIEILEECFDYIFFQDKNLNLLRAAAFIKRLFTVLLGFPEKSVIKSLNLIQKLIKKHPKLNYFLSSNEKHGEGIYNGEIDNPDLSNPYLSTCWELILLKKHYSPTISNIVDTLFHC